MNIENIIKYMELTPWNTNMSILRQLIDYEIDNRERKKQILEYAKRNYRNLNSTVFAGMLDTSNFPPSIEDLQSKYNFAYYSSMSAAVTAVNNGTSNADVDKADAVAGVYTDQKGGVNVVLLKDTMETATISVSADMNINLGGHTLTHGGVDLAASDIAIDIVSGNVVIDGRLIGSAVKAYNPSNHVIVFRIQASGNAVFYGGSYIAENGSENSSKKTACIIMNYGKATAYDCKIMSETTNGNSMAIQCSGSATLTISNCHIKSTATDGKSLGVSNSGTGTVTNCDIRAYSNYHKDGDNYLAYSQGVVNKGSITISDCYVLGTHSGVQNGGTLYVNGGTYEAYGHGGIYFGTGTTAAYVRNATLKDSLTMPDEYIATSQRNGAGFYIGGSVDACNMTVYMDNCKAYGEASQIVLRGTKNEQNNTLYISRSKLYDLDGNTLSVRIDNETHKLYLGKDCNFTAENTTLPSAVIVTDEVYVYNKN